MGVVCLLPEAIALAILSRSRSSWCLFYYVWWYYTSIRYSLKPTGIHIDYSPLYSVETLGLVFTIDSSLSKQ